MKYIIHIGQSKTGTTSLQEFLAKNRYQLSERGVLYPDVFVNGTPLNMSEHNALADSLTATGGLLFPGLSAEEYFEQFEEQAQEKNCHTIILSAESFFGAPQIWRVDDEADFWRVHKDKLERLRQFVEGHDVQVIGYLRHQSDWFEGAVSHIIRMEGLLGHSVYESDEQVFEYLKPHMDYKRVIDLWRGVFPDARLSLIPFERKGLVNQSSIDDFCAHVPIDMNGLNVCEVSQNVGLDRRYVWLKAQLNRKKRGKAKERVTIDLLSDLSARLEDIQKFQISPELRAKVQDFCVHENEALCKTYQLDTPNILTQPREVDWRGEVTEEEKKDALKSYNRAVRSKRAIYLYIRYSVGAFLRQYAPSLNAFIKKIVKQ